MANKLKALINRLLGRRTEAEYYAWLLQYGRIIEGEIIDLQRENGEVRIFYSYSISNVQYESSQELRPDQLTGNYKYQPGLPVTVRFDPRNPGCSIVQ
ncbi:MAG: DUF3592 domain-containing protein [Blastocatellia bacterium]